MIKLLLISNPLEPAAEASRLTGELEPVSGKPLRNYLIDAKLDSPELSVSVNGQVYAGDELDHVLPIAGDYLILVARLGNSGLVKTLGAVAVLAIATVVTGGLATGPLAALGAGGLGTFFAGIGLGGLSATTVGVIGAGIAVGGNLLVSAIAGALAPAAKQASPSYDPDGPRSLAQSGVVLPKAYGLFQWGGNLISSFTDVEGQDSYINALYCYGYGPVRSLDTSKILVSGKPVSEYQNVQVVVRLGTNDQTAIGNFNRIVNGYPQITQCLSGIPVVVPGVGTETLIGQVDIQFPDGVGQHTNDGNLIPLIMIYMVEYSPAGLNQWAPVVTPRTTTNVVGYDPVTGNLIPTYVWVLVATDLPPSSGVVYHADSGQHNVGDVESVQVLVAVFQPNGSYYNYNKTCTGEWQYLDPTLNQVYVNTWNEGYINFLGASDQTLYNRTTIYYPSKAKWDVRITKYGSGLFHGTVLPGDNFVPNVHQDMYVHSVNEITPIDLVYPNMILIGVRALATSQLNGGSLNVTAPIQHGCRTRDTGLLPAALAAFEDDNPAVVAADMMLDRLYGGGRSPGIQPANIERYIDEWVAWAELNDQLVDDGNGGSIRRHVFRGVFDTEGNLWDALGQVGAMSRAQVLQFGRDYGVYVDQPDVPVQMFSMGNLSADSFTETFLELDSRANQVEVQFADSTRYYKSDNPLTYMEPYFQDAGVPVKNVRIRANGVVVPAQAWHLARFRERGNEFLLRTGSITASLQAIACRPGNVIILQHDVPQWGWGGRTELGCTLTQLIVDRLDLAFTPGTASSSVILIFPALLQYTGTVTAVAAQVDGSGAPIGTLLTLSSFDNVSRVMRAIVTNPGSAPVDCAIKANAAGSVTVQPPPGFVPVVNAAYQLFDTDVLVTRTVAAIDLIDGHQVLTLAAPLPQLPEDFSTYFFGPTGSQKLARVVSIRRMNDWKAKLEWIDYDPAVYLDATPTFGSTYAQITTNPAVTSLTGSEVFTKVSGSYVPSIALAWKNGPDTAGVAIYASYSNQSAANPSANGRGIPQLVARVTGGYTSYSLQPTLNEAVTYTIVGFDSAGDYASFASAPAVTITAGGVAVNLLLGSNFASGFTYWNRIARAGDLLVPSLDDDGQAVYTVQGTPLTAAQTVLFQYIPPSKWAVGQSLMLSSYFEDTAPTSASDTGNWVASLVFQDASGAELGQADALYTLNGATPSLGRRYTPATVIPANTAAIVVRAGFSGSSLNIPVDAVLTVSHLLLEVCDPGQSSPSEWADIDAAGHILSLFTTGSSLGLRVQGSLLPSLTGGFTFNYDSSTILILWTDLVILWPDGGYTYIQDGQQQVSGLPSATTGLMAYPYFDVVQGTVEFALVATPVGSPGIVSATPDTLALASCQQDGHVPLSTDGLVLMTGTASTGTGGGGTGGGGTGGGGTGTGGGGGGGGHPPILPPPGFVEQ